MQFQSGLPPILFKKEKMKKKKTLQKHTYLKRRSVQSEV
jgi:hypothetical protein